MVTSEKELKSTEVHQLLSKNKKGGITIAVPKVRNHEILFGEFMSLMTVSRGLKDTLNPEHLRLLKTTTSRPTSLGEPTVEATTEGNPLTSTPF